jgi:hypothetical protein
MVALAAGLLVACGDSKQTVETTQVPSAPKGAVVGQVTSLRTGAPLQGVSVTAQGPGGSLVTATTDAAGAYALSGLPAGVSYLVRFSASSYVGRFGSATIPDTAGNFPTDNGIVQLNIALAQANATINGHVYARDGAPAAGVVLGVDLRGLGYDLVAQATTDAAGAYTLSGLPGAPSGLAATVVTQPWDANADGTADYESLSRAVSTFPSAATLLDLDLRLAAVPLTLLTSNLEAGTLPVSSSIQLTFNRPLDPLLTTATLSDSTAGKSVAVLLSVDATGRVLTVSAAGGTDLAAFHAYLLGVAAVATNGGQAAVSRGFTAVTASGLLPAVANLTVSPSNADFDTTTFGLTWDAVPAATGYQIFARDTASNPSYLLIKTVGSSPAPATSVTLPASFDHFTGDAVQTPFAFGVAVDLAVVAVNAAGAAPDPSTATPVRRADAVAPVVEWAYQTGIADNGAGATSRTVLLNLTFSEYMDTGVLPAITLPGAGLTASFAWNANRTSGTFSIVIPASTDGRGAYSVSGAKDTSGNLMAAAGGTLTSVVQLVANGDFETGALGGWTPSYTAGSTSTSPVATSAVAATGTWSAQIGNATASIQYGSSTLVQSVTLPAGSASITASVAYRAYTNYAFVGHDTNSCVVTNSAGTLTLATLFSTYANMTTFSTATASLTAYAGQAVRIVCQTYQDGSHVTGMYVDDVSILATP